MEGVIILSWLMIKHCLADYFLQTTWMINDKPNYGKPGGLFHSGEHGVLTWITLSFFINPFLALVYGLLDFALHYHIDWTKSNYIRGNFRFSQSYLTQVDPQYWWAMGIDQTLHFLTYVLIVWLCLT